MSKKIAKLDSDNIINDIESDEDFHGAFPEPLPKEAYAPYANYKMSPEEREKVFNEIKELLKQV